VPATGVVNADVPAANAPTPTPGIGWSTDDPAKVLELWQNGFLGVPADSGSQFVEINANAQDTLTQDLATVPGSRIRWHLAHRGRAGTDTMQLRVGAPGGPLIAQVPDGQAGVDIADGTTSWGHYTGVYQVPAGQTTTRFAFAAVAEAFAPSFGNFLDSVSMTVLPTANDDLATTLAGHSVAVPVLANDCGSALTVHAVGSTSHGVAAVVGSSVRYTPNATFDGVDHFTYTLVDASGDTATATVTVHVLAPTSPQALPERSSGGVGVVQQVRPPLAPGSVLRLVDAQGHLTTGIGLAGQGVYAVSGQTLTFTPADGFIGQADPVRYQITDVFGQAATSTYTATVVEAAGGGGLPDTGAGALGPSVTIGLGLVVVGLFVLLLVRRRPRSAGV
jgi:CshA-type fibril repeat protein